MSRYRHLKRGGRGAQRSRRKLNDTPTPAEAAISRALDDLGIKHETNYTVRTAESTGGFYLVDVYVPHARLFIELDGKPHVGLHAEWRDRLRTDAILRAKPGHELIRAWNADVLGDPHAWIVSNVPAVDGCEDAA